MSYLPNYNQNPKTSQGDNDLDDVNSAVTENSMSSSTNEDSAAPSVSSLVDSLVKKYDTTAQSPQKKEQPFRKLRPKQSADGTTASTTPSVSSDEPQSTRSQTGINSIAAVKLRPVTARADGGKWNKTSSQSPGDDASSEIDFKTPQSASPEIPITTSNEDVLPTESSTEGKPKSARSMWGPRITAKRPKTDKKVITTIDDTKEGADPPTTNDATSKTAANEVESANESTTESKGGVWGPTVKRKSPIAAAATTTTVAVEEESKSKAPWGAKVALRKTGRDITGDTQHESTETTKDRQEVPAESAENDEKVSGEPTRLVETEATTTSTSVVVDDKVPQNLMKMWGETVKAKKPIDPSHMSYRAKMSQAEKVRERIQKAKQSKKWSIAVAKEKTDVAEATASNSEATETDTNSLQVQNDVDVAALFFGKEKQAQDIDEDDAAALFFGTEGKSDERKDDMADDTSSILRESVRQDADSSMFEVDGTSNDMKHEDSKDDAAALFFGSEDQADETIMVEGGNSDNDAAALFFGSTNKMGNSGDDDNVASKEVAEREVQQNTSVPGPRKTATYESDSDSSGSSSDDESPPKTSKGTVSLSGAPKEENSDHEVKSLVNESHKSAAHQVVSNEECSEASSSDDSSSSSASTQEKPTPKALIPIPVDKASAKSMDEQDSSSSESSGSSSSSRTNGNLKSAPPITSKVVADDTTMTPQAKSDDGTTSSSSSSSSSSSGSSSSSSSSGSSSRSSSSGSLKPSKTQSSRKSPRSGNSSEAAALVLGVEAIAGQNGTQDAAIGTPVILSEEDRKTEALFHEMEARGISPTILVTKDDDAKTKVSGFSTADDSYVFDLLQQREDRDEIQREEVMEEALERYNAAVSEGQPESEELYFRILDEVKKEKEVEFKERNITSDRRLQLAMLVKAQKKKEKPKIDTNADLEGGAEGETKSQSKEIEEEADKKAAEMTEEVKSSSAKEKKSQDAALNATSSGTKNELDEVSRNKSTPETSIEDEVDEDDSGDTETSDGFEEFDDEYDEEKAELDERAVELSRKEAELFKREETLTRRKFAFVALLCCMTFGLLLLFVLDPLGRRDDGVVFGKQSSPPESTEPINLEEVSTTSRHSLVVKGGKTVNEPESTYASELMTVYDDMIQGLYSEMLSGRRRYGRFLRGLSDLQVVSSIDKWTVHEECPKFSFLVDKDLCVDIHVEATSLVDSRQVNSTNFVEAVREATLGCSFETKFVNSVRDSDIQFLTQEDDSGNLVCGDSIFSSPSEAPSSTPTVADGLMPSSLNGTASMKTEAPTVTVSEFPTTVSIKSMPTSAVPITPSLPTPTNANTDDDWNATSATADDLDLEVLV